jgi:2-phosphosulfolactate phosphatase
MSDWFAQEPHGVRFDWGPAGARRLAPASACLVIVDVLSFSTAVTVADETGIRVFPCPRHDGAAAAFARRQRAVLASAARAGSPDVPWSLSPAVLRRAPFTPRLVLPSPNGSAIAAAATTTPSRTDLLASSLRNVTATSRWLTGHGLGTPDRPVTVVAAGERWPDGSLRPALEDLLGAGAVIAALARAGGGPLSPEGAAARGCYETTPDVAAALAGSASGRELSQRGCAADIAIAAEIDTCGVAAVLVNGAFEAAGRAAR